MIILVEAKCFGNTIIAIESPPSSSVSTTSDLRLNSPEVFPINEDNQFLKKEGNDTEE